MRLHTWCRKSGKEGRFLAERWSKYSLGRDRKRNQSFAMGRSARRVAASELPQSCGRVWSLASQAQMHGKLRVQSRKPGESLAEGAQHGHGGPASEARQPVACRALDFESPCT